MSPIHRARASRVLLAAAATACGPQTVDLDLNGTVTRLSDGTPLSDVVVLLTWSPGPYQVEAAEARTGPDGRYTLQADDVACDEMQLGAGGPTLMLDTEPVACTSEPQTIDFRLDPR